LSIFSADNMLLRRVNLLTQNLCLHLIWLHT
jgi:hypothetical protein